MKTSTTRSTKSAVLLWRLVLLCGFGLAGSGLCRAAAGEEFDTLYLKDGSVLKGTILKDSRGDYLVYTAFGELTVEAGEVIYSTSREKTPPLIQETHIFIGATSETISIVAQDVPERREGAPSFNLLLAGVAASVRAENGDAIPYMSRLVGENSLVTIAHADVPAKTQRLQITLWQVNLLTALDSQSVKFQKNYTPDIEGQACVMVKYPKEWKVRSVAPTPSKQFEGLIVWRQRLRRQQTFTPEVVFQF